MQNEKRFAAFILSHGRPDNIVTLKSLEKAGYTGEIYIVIDDEDEQADKYFELYGNMVLQFNKREAAKVTDTGDNNDDRRAVVYARNVSQRMAKDMGYKYILQLDDDYSSFYYRTPKDGKLKTVRVKSFDKIVDAMLELLDVTGATTIAFSQGGDFLGGINRNYLQGMTRKAMNSFFLRTDKPIEFMGKINEDVNAYVVHGGRGDLYFTVAKVQLTQMQTQKSAGGLTDIYLDAGTYVKSFYTVMMAPSCTTIRPMGITDRRLHHSIKWENAVPKIISDKHRKPRADINE
jgi:hypothetical protein